MFSLYTLEPFTAIERYVTTNDSVCFLNDEKSTGVFLYNMEYYMERKSIRDYTPLYKHMGILASFLNMLPPDGVAVTLGSRCSWLLLYTDTTLTPDSSH